eukprot:GHVU01180233.1.p1 GENE.GHVU01180233.1~~GHVU01180233.1.p1  ORF type:complete len:195 (+),score=21.09 GHVU01180233.1:75-659(+)
MRKIILGVVGNMGVEADICFQSAILEKTEAATDQDHIAVVVVKNPDIPDRSTAILKGGTSPVEQICATVRVLERAGCKLAVMPCVTAHYFLKEIQQSCKDIEFVSILDATGDALKRLGEGRVVGLLATTGTGTAFPRYLRLPYSPCCAGCCAAAGCCAGCCAVNPVQSTQKCLKILSTDLASNGKYQPQEIRKH